MRLHEQGVVGHEMAVLALERPAVVVTRVHLLSLVQFDVRLQALCLWRVSGVLHGAQHMLWRQLAGQERREVG